LLQLLCILSCTKNRDNVKFYASSKAKILSCVNAFFPVYGGPFWGETPSKKFIFPPPPPNILEVLVLKKDFNIDHFAPIP